MGSFPLVKSRADQVIGILRERLAQADAEQGARLPAERDLAAQLNVSRRTLREALQVLEDEKLIERQPGRGTVILKKEAATMARMADSPVLSAQLLADIRKYTSPRELIEARLLLEPTVASMAAVHATSHDIDAIRQAIEESEKIDGDPRQWEKLDSAFHASLGKATQNALVVLFLAVLTSAREHTAWGRLRKASLTPARQEGYIAQHRAILAAIEERDPDGAANAMRQHLHTVRQTLLEHLEGV